MSKLDDFLGLTDVSEIRKEISVKLDGKELNLTIRPLNEDEHIEFQRRSQTVTKNKMIFDTGKYNSLIIENCIVEPNFSDEGFLKKVKCISASEFLKKKFTAGVLTDIAQQIQELSGFESYEMEIENAKN
jgi:hypothetical protein